MADVLAWCPDVNLELDAKNSPATWRDVMSTHGPSIATFAFGLNANAAATATNEATA